VLAAGKMLREFEPDVVIGVGGYASGPAMMAAILKHVPTLAFEPNLVPGFANRVVARFVSAAAVHFERTADYFRNPVVTGVPVRPAFFQIPRKPYSQASATLLVFGGSQGARAINQAVVQALPELMKRVPGLRVIHQTGERDYEEVVAAYRNAGPPPAQVEVVPFLFDVPRAFRQADLIVSRSGATTVAEITACGKPAILIPFPHAIHGHQERTARILERAGAATVILDAGLTGELLAAAITALLADPGRLGEMGRCSKALGRADSAERIVMACRALVGKGGAPAGGAPSR